MAACALPVRAQKIVGLASKRCVGGPDTQQARLVDCSGAQAVQWQLTAGSEIRRVDQPTRCLDIYRNNVASRTPVYTWPCNGGANQRWTVGTGPNATAAIHPSGRSDLCLDAKAAATAVGTALQIFACNDRSNQLWRFDPQTVVDEAPPTPPGTPVLSALSCDSVQVDWSASCDNVLVTAYDIYHDGQLMSSVLGNVLSAKLVLVPGAKWGIYINARDAAGNLSQASPTTALEVPQCSPDTQPPTVPSALSGTVSGTSIALTWQASTDNIAVVTYEILRDATVVGKTGGSGAPPVTAFTDTGLQPNRTYSYTVRAVDAQDNRSALSKAVALRTAASCADIVCGIQLVLEDTDIPWGIAPLGDAHSSFFYSRRDAHNIVYVDPELDKKIDMGVLPSVTGTDGEGGLLGLAVDASFALERWLYIMYTTAADNRVVRMKVQDNFLLALDSEQVLLQGIARNKFHNGGRLRFGPDNKLYVSTGDAQNQALAQNLNSLNGKILRINSDGSVPSDNPYGNRVWTYGHRNPQGLAFDAPVGFAPRLYEQEFGNSIMDETNLLAAGGNYGWPNCEGTASVAGQGCATSGYRAPVFTLPTAEGSCSGIAAVNQRLWLACARGTRLYSAAIAANGSLDDIRQLYVGTYGRLRTVEPSGDGNLYLSTSNGGDKDSIPDNSKTEIFKVTLGQPRAAAGAAQIFG